MVAGFFEDGGDKTHAVREGDAVSGDAGAMVLRPDAGLVAAGDEGGAADAADRGGDKGACEFCTCGGECIDVRGGDAGVAVAREVGGHVFGEDPDDVGAFGRGSLTDGSGSEQGKEDSGKHEAESFILLIAGDSPRGRRGLR